MLAIVECQDVIESVSFFIVFCLYFKRTVDSQEAKWEREREREGGEIRKGPQARIQTWDARSAMTLFVGTLPKKAIGTNVSSVFVEYFALLAHWQLFATIIDFVGMIIV